MWHCAVVGLWSRPRKWHRRRRVGLTTLLLFCGTAAAALVLAHYYHLGVAATVVAVLVSGGAPAGLYLTCASYRLSASQVEDQFGGPAGVAEALAAAIRDQWQAEAGVRRLNDPYPLPVSWVAADASLADSWDLLVTLARSGAGWPSPPPPGTWATRPDELAGGGDQLVKVLAQVPTGRLVVLGEPGAGKTMLMVRLVLDLLADRATGVPVPVLASLASWNPSDQDLHSWLAD